MQFAFTDEQQMIRESARAFLEAEASLPAVRLASGAVNGYDEGLWQQMTAELGWSGIAIPEAYGGAGLGFVELGILAHEQGRRLVPSPFFSTVCLATPVILELAREEQKRQWLPAIAAGQLKAAVAVTDRVGHADIRKVGVKLAQVGSAWVLSGEAHFVVGAQSADLLLVVASAKDANASQSLRVVAVASGTAGVRIEATEMLDVTRPMASIYFEQVSVSAEDCLGGGYRCELGATAGARSSADDARGGGGGGRRVLARSGHGIRQRAGAVWARHWQLSGNQASPRRHDGVGGGS